METWAKDELHRIGRTLRWYRAAMNQRAGPITAAGITKEVTFEPVDGAIQASIDDACRVKYKDESDLPTGTAANQREEIETNATTR